MVLPTLQPDELLSLRAIMMQDVTQAFSPEKVNRKVLGFFNGHKRLNVTELPQDVLDDLHWLTTIIAYAHHPDVSYGLVVVDGEPVEAGPYRVAPVRTDQKLRRTGERFDMPLNMDALLADIPEKFRRDVPRVVNRLLGQTFLYQDVETDKDDYYFVHRYRSIFEVLLGLAGFQLLHDDYHRIFQAVSDYSYCRAHYRLDETLMIVVLRKLYEERVEHFSLANDPVVTIGEVREEYRTITGQGTRPGDHPVRNLLRRLRSMGLVDTLEGRSIDVRDADARLRLRGSVRMILPVQTADELEAWLRKYRSAAWMTTLIDERD